MLARMRKGVLALAAGLLLTLGSVSTASGDIVIEDADKVVLKLLFLEGDLTLIDHLIVKKVVEGEEVIHEEEMGEEVPMGEPIE